MLIGGDGISNDVITLGTCFLMLVSFALIGGLIAQEFKFQRRSCKFSFFSPLCQSAPESFLAGYPRSVCYWSIVFLVVV